MLPGMLGLGGKMPGEQFMNSYYPFIIAISIGIFFGIRHYFRGHQWTSVGDLRKKIIVITGANSGIGLELTKIFGECGAKVYMGCRSKERADEAIKNISKLVHNPSLHFIPLDLSSFDSVKAFAAAFLKRESRLDILVNNAGVLASPGPQITKDGVDLHFQVNYLGHFLLTHLLLDTLKATPHSRVVNNTSHAHNLVTLQLEGLVDQSYLTSHVVFHSESAPLLSSQSSLKKVRLSEAGDNGIEAIHEENHEDDGEFEKGSGDDGEKSSEIIAKDKNEIVSKNKDELASKNSDKSGVSNGDEEGMNADDKANRMNRHYAYSKLSLVMFTIKMAEVLDKKSPVVLVANPGVAFTDIYRHMAFRKSIIASFIATPFLWYVSKNAKDGAQTALYCSTCPELEAKSGKYFADCAEKEIKEKALDTEKVDLLYEVSKRVCEKWLK